MCYLCPLALHQWSVSDHSFAVGSWVMDAGFHNIWILHNIKGNIRYYLFAWFGPFLLSLIGCILYYLIFNNYYDSNFSYLSSIYEASGISLSSTQLLPIIISQLIMSALFAPLLNFVNCFGEELGWRGYLLPKMLEKHKLAPTLVINGIIWGLWHAPLTVIIGHNYGFGYFGYPFTGILAMCIFCIVIGIIFSYITVKTKSCLPATFAHASLNGIASVGFLFASSQEAIKPFIGPAPTGIIGGSAFIITSIIIFYVWNKEQKGLPK